MPRRSASRACASTQSSTVTSGKSEPHGRPVAEFFDSGPVEPKQLPRLLTPMTKKTLGVERLARPDHVVPPADVVGVVGVVAGDVVRRVQRVADQDGVGAVVVQLAIGLVGEFVVVERPAAGQLQRPVEIRGVGHDRTHRARQARRGGARSVGRGGRRGHRVDRVAKSPASLPRLDGPVQDRPGARPL